MVKISELVDFLNQLEARKISYQLKKVRPDGLMVLVTVPGEKWEIEFMADNTVEIEKFKSEGKIYDEKELFVLFRDFSD